MLTISTQAGQKEPGPSHRTGKQQERHGCDVGDDGQPVWHDLRPGPERTDGQHVHRRHAQETVTKDLAPERRSVDNDLTSIKRFVQL